jgi:hypothetical protein
MRDKCMVDRYRPLDRIKLLKCEAHPELKLMRHTNTRFLREAAQVRDERLKSILQKRIAHNRM